jgi:hypothetical protein
VGTSGENRKRNRQDILRHYPRSDNQTVQEERGGEMEIIGALFVILMVAISIWYIKKAIWGKCPYCGSKNFVPDDGLLFYCNRCKCKF